MATWNQVRRHRRSGRHKPETADFGDSLAAANGIEATIVLGEVERAMAKMPPEKRAPLMLVGVFGLKYDEAAAALGIPIGTLRSRLSRARLELHDRLDTETADVEPERKGRSDGYGTG